MTSTVKTETTPKANDVIVPLTGESLIEAKDDQMDEDWELAAPPVRSADTLDYASKSPEPSYRAGIRQTQAAPEPGRAPSIADDPVIKRAIQAEVANVLAQMGLQNVSAPAVMHKPADAVRPPAFLKHYRNDRSPTVSYQELDMRALDRGERPQAYPIPGSFIRFRNGHFYAMTDNQVRQMEWMIENPAYAADGMSVIGGDPAIYEDDDAMMYHCHLGCDWPGTPSKSSYRAHMRSIHGVNITS